MAQKKRGKGRRSDVDCFLETLEALGGEENKAIGNQTLRETLGFSSDKYNRVKELLLDQNRIIKARGRGGAVSLVSTQDETGLSVFVSYSHKDKVLKEKLLEHLKPLERINLIETWTDKEIKPGQEWRSEIVEKLNVADVILLLISVDFINSDFCYQIELEKAMERHEGDEARVIPIILRACLWNHTPFAKLQALPTSAKAVTSWPDIDGAMTDIARGVEVVARDLLFNR